MYRVALMALCIVVNVSWASRPKQISNAPFRTLFLPAQVNQIARSADGKLLAVATHNGLYLCQTSVETKPQLLIEGHLKSTTFNSTGTLLAAGGRDDFGRGKVYIMELETGEFVELIGHTKTIYSVCFSPLVGFDNSLKFKNDIITRRHSGRNETFVIILQAIKHTIGRIEENNSECSLIFHY